MTQAKRIAVLHGGALGDLILTLRLTGALCRRFDPVALTLYARIDLSGLAGDVGGVDAFRDIERVGLHALFNANSAVDPNLLRELDTFDLLVNCMAGSNSVLAHRLHELARGTVVSFSPAPRSDSIGHITDQWLDDLAVQGLDPPRDGAPKIALPPECMKRTRERLGEQVGSNTSPIVMLHPGSGGRTKCWPQANFCRLAEVLRVSGLEPVFLVGPVELEQHGQPLLTQLERSAPVRVDPELVAAAASISAATVYVGNDAGMTHLAAALGVPTVALFGPTNPTTWQPLGSQVRVLGGNGTADDPFANVTVESAHDLVASCVAKNT